jgi:hypothetical protein
MPKKSGPNPPHGTVVVKSGPNPPHGGGPVAGPSPQGGLPARPGAGASSGTATATAEAKEPGAETREDTVTLTVSIPKPKPFSVFVKVDEGSGVQIDSIQIRICKDHQPSVMAFIEADLPIVLNESNESHVFPLGEEHLKLALPRLKAGETVEVKVHYLAPDKSQIRIGVIGTEHHGWLRNFIPHFSH